MAYENIVAVFDVLSNADAAVGALRAAGVGESDIHLHSSAEAAAAATDTESVWDRLLGEGVPDSDREIYRQAVAHGWFVVSVKALVEKAEDAMAILDSHKPVDLHEWLETYGAPGASDEGHEPGPVRRFSLTETLGD